MLQEAARIFFRLILAYLNFFLLWVHLSHHFSNGRSLRGRRKTYLEPLNFHWTLREEGERGSRELLVDVKEKRSKIAVFYLAKSFTERLEISEFH